MNQQVRQSKQPSNTAAFNATNTSNLPILINQSKIRSDIGQLRGSIHAKNKTQAKVFADLNDKQMSALLGVAGTGKTFLALAKGIELLLSGKVSTIVLARPAVEAGEKLGYLPGDIHEKLGPYMAPLTSIIDPLFKKASDKIEQSEHQNAEFFDPPSENAKGKGKSSNGNRDDSGYKEERRDALETIKLKIYQHIEIVPIGFMQGRTFNDAYIIIDEAQNMSKEQVKMAMTRLGFGSRMVFTGDPDQCNLPNRGNKLDGMSYIYSVLEKMRDLALAKNNFDLARPIYWHEFEPADNVRDPLVALAAEAIHAIDGTTPPKYTKKCEPINVKTGPQAALPAPIAG